MKRVLPVIIFVFVLLIAGLAIYIDWTWKRQLSPRGGRYFFHRLELAVPVFKQSDEKWRDDPLGGVVGNGTLGGQGCALARDPAVAHAVTVAEADPLVVKEVHVTIYHVLWELVQVFLERPEVIV